MTQMKIDRLNQCSPAHRGLYQIFIKDGVNEGEDLELDELNNSGCSQRQRQQPQCALGETPATSNQMLMPNRANVSPTSTPPTPPEDGQKSEKNGEPTHEGLSEPAPVVALRNGKTQTSLKTMSKRKISQQKEKKATQMLAIVLGKQVLLYVDLFFTGCVALQTSSLQKRSCLSRPSLLFFFWPPVKREKSPHTSAGFADNLARIISILTPSETLTWVDHLAM